MTQEFRLNRFFASYPAVASLCYVVLVAALAPVAWFALADVLDRRSALAESEHLLAQLDRGRGAAAAATRVPGEAPQGSPFLEGQTVTQAGAALLQRVAGVITRVGGNVLSSQVDVRDAQAKSGLVSLVASIEVAQPDLQKLLYELESGMPYVFVDQLTVQVPDSVTRGEGGRLRVVLGVSGQWQGGK